MISEQDCAAAAAPSAAAATAKTADHQDAHHPRKNHDNSNENGSHAHARAPPLASRSLNDEASDARLTKR